MNRARATWAASAIVALSLAACSGGGSGPDVASIGDRGSGGETTSTLSAEDAALRFARCMREQGIEMDDPDENGAVIIRFGADSDALRAAQEACAEFAPRLGSSSIANDPELQDRLRAMARCMRERGFDIPDPIIGGSGGSSGEPPAPPDAGQIDPEDPAFRDAERECARETGAPSPGAGGPQAGEP